MTSNGVKSNHKFNNFMRNLGLGLTMVGFLVFLLGADPDLVGLDRSPYVGFVQITTFSFGLAIICLGGFISFKNSQQEDRIQSLAQDIGIRLVATGYVISLISGMADVFGFGTQPWPAVPSFGPRQAAGVILGEVIIAIGFILYMPFFSTKA
jgi:hypothetical protein